MRVGDSIPLDADDIPQGVSEVMERGGTVWWRAVGDERFVRLPSSGRLIRSVLDDNDRTVPPPQYDWVASGGWRTTEGMLAAARRDGVPLRIAAVGGFAKAERRRGS